MLVVKTLKPLGGTEGRHKHRSAAKTMGWYSTYLMTADESAKAAAAAHAGRIILRNDRGVQDHRGHDIATMTPPMRGAGVGAANGDRETITIEGVNLALLPI